MKSFTSLPDPIEDDWRLNATARLANDWDNPWTGETVPQGTRITVSSIMRLTRKKQLTIPLPNATALLLNSSAIAYKAACVIRESSGIDKTLKNDVSFQSDKDAFDYIERMIEAVILAFTALEAFVNESIPIDFEYVCHARSEAIVEIKSKSNIERHINIDEKLTVVLPEILNCASPKGSRCWGDYRRLKKVRDRLIHMKTVDCKSSGVEIDTVWKAVISISSPHFIVKAMIDHFAKSMPKKPGWHSRFPYGKG